MVAAALIFLFTSEKGEMINVAGKAEKEISDLKKEIINLVSGETPPQPIKRIGKKHRVGPSEFLPVSIAEKSVQKPNAKTRDPIPHQKKVKVTTSPKTELATVEKAGSLDRDISKRRREVLEEETGITTTEKGPSFMPPTTRKRELLVLAEEMEILAAKLASE